MGAKILKKQTPIVKTIRVFEIIIDET